MRPSLLSQHSISQRCTVYVPCESLASWYSKSFNFYTALVPLRTFSPQQKGSLRKHRNLTKTRFPRSFAVILQKTFCAFSDSSGKTFSYFDSCAHYTHDYPYHCDSSASISPGERASHELLASRQSSAPLNRTAHCRDCQNISNFWRPTCHC